MVHSEAGDRGRTHSASPAGCSGVTLRSTERIGGGGHLREHGDVVSFIGGLKFLLYRIGVE